MHDPDQKTRLWISTSKMFRSKVQDNHRGKTPGLNMEYFDVSYLGMMGRYPDFVKLFNSFVPCEYDLSAEIGEAALRQSDDAVVR
mmetsp:Transcript_36675/g.53882  ORF Transcript_36675/g.53882 Transcript_36675/m.53882 type:complete len:85 (-) Transcript_36675:161-415(-)